MTQMDFTMLGEGAQLLQGSLIIEEASLYKAFEQVKDGRKEKGKRYPLALILSLLFLGKMAGEKNIKGVVEWVQERKNLLKQLFS